MSVIVFLSMFQPCDDHLKGPPVQRHRAPPELAVLNVHAECAFSLTPACSAAFGHQGAVLH